MIIKKQGTCLSKMFVLADVVTNKKSTVASSKPGNRNSYKFILNWMAVTRVTFHVRIEQQLILIISWRQPDVLKYIHLYISMMFGLFFICSRTFFELYCNCARLTTNTLINFALFCICKTIVNVNSLLVLFFKQ